MLNVNQYFEGKVMSIGLQTESQAATVGVMDVGEYQFKTKQYEVMTVVIGQLVAKLPSSDRWQEFKAGESFEVAAGLIFYIKVSIQTAYVCTYQDK
jgi:uncharacterized protein YaiE (UPF0345 family)